MFIFPWRYPKMLFCPKVYTFTHEYYIFTQTHLRYFSTLSLPCFWVKSFILSDIQNLPNFAKTEPFSWKFWKKFGFVWYYSGTLKSILKITPSIHLFDWIKSWNFLVPVMFDVSAETQEYYTKFIIVRHFLFIVNVFSISFSNKHLFSSSSDAGDCGALFRGAIATNPPRTTSRSDAHEFSSAKT